MPPPAWLGLLPGYATLGVAAPLLLLLLRVIQGIGLGGEFGGASSLLAEFGAQRKHRAFWMSLANSAFRWAPWLPAPSCSC